MANHSGCTHSAVLAAIVEAANELQDVEKQLEQIQAQLQKQQERARYLQQFIMLGKRLLGEESAETKISDPRERGGGISANSAQSALSPRRSAADYAKQVLEDVQRPMRAMEMADYLHQRGLMQGRWTREVLRTAMRKNEQTFERVAEGVYALKAWSPEQKSIPEQGVQSLFSQAQKEDADNTQPEEEDADSPPNMSQPLTACIVELLKAAKSPMSPLEMRQEFAARGRSVTKKAIHSALSKLFHSKRISKPETGRYMAIRPQETQLGQNGAV